MDAPIDSYREAWCKRWADLRRREAERADHARASLPAIVELLVRSGARRVVLFGSLARGRFGLDSDIDVAVEGLADPFRAAADAERETGFELDVVPIESAFPHVLRRVEVEGVVLHELAR
jgi:predicted nucleotidyltransferase